MYVLLPVLNKKKIVLYWKLLLVDLVKIQYTRDGEPKL